MLLISGNLVVRTGSVESQEAFEEANTAQHCSTIHIKMRMAMQGDNFECLLDDDGLKHIDLFANLWTHDMENTWIQRFKLEQSCVVELWIQSWSGLN